LKNIYFISGLGADKRAFSFLDLSFCNSIFIDWIKPVPSESLKQYALRLRETIPEAHPTLIGVSFGGMLVTEMAKADPQCRAIIISSAKSIENFPRYFKVPKYLPAYNLIPAQWLKKISLVFGGKLGARGELQRQTLKEIMTSTDPHFSKWAINALLHWDNTVVPGNLIHIHGSADRLLPCKKVNADYIIDGGTHLMIMNDHKQISTLLKELTACD